MDSQNNETQNIMSENKTSLSFTDFPKGKNPFKVPEGYFENLPAQIMMQLPQREANKTCALPQENQNVLQPRASHWWTPSNQKRMLWCACSVAAVLIAGVFLVNQYMDRQAEEMNAQNEYNEEYVDEFCDYTRVKTTDAMAYITNDETF